MIKICICDCNQKTASEIEQIIINMNKNLNILDTEVFFSTKSLCDGLLEQEKFDVFILSSKMKTEGGVLLGESINEYYKNRALLFYIAYEDKLDIHIIETKPFGIILYPFNNDEVISKIYGAIKHLESGDDLFFFKVHRIVYHISKQSIICLESSLRKIILHSTDIPEMMFYGSLKKEIIHFKNDFYSPHSSFIVNLSLVKEFHSDYWLLLNDKVVPIPLRKRKIVKKYLTDYFIVKKLNSTLIGSINNIIPP